MSEVKQKILKQIEELEKSMPSLKEAAKPVKLDQSAVGRLSRMDALRAQGMQQRAYDSALAKLGSLKSSLQKVDDDDFGLCSECEEPIGVERILAVPESSLCINCARKLG